MTYDNIYNFDDLKAYCKVKHYNFKHFTPHLPQCEPSTPNVLLYMMSNNSGALGYRLFQTPIHYNKVITLRGIIYSYYTPIGLITDSGSLIIGISKEFPFKSVTTKRLVTILNRHTYNLHVETLKIVLLDLNIELVWLE